MGVVIRILDNSNNVLGDLDLANFKDFPLALTKGIVNLDNLKARTGTFSKTFKVPNTKNNSKLLSNIDNINSKKDYRDALGRKPCVIMVDNSQNDAGFLQVSKAINKDYFELIFFGNNIDWVKSASELKLNSIIYNNNSQVYNELGINTANAATSDTYDHAYPYISRGGNVSFFNTSVEDFYPTLYIKNIIERGLNQLGWNVSSNFLTDANIKKLSADLSNDMKVVDSVINQSKTRAQFSSDVVDYGGDIVFKFDDDSSSPNNDNNNNYTPLTGIYIVPSNGRYDINVSVKTDDWIVTGTTKSISVKMYSGSGTSIILPVNLKDVQTKTVSTTQGQTTNFKLSAILTQGDKLQITHDWTPNPFSSVTEEVKFKDGTFFEIQRSPKLTKGDTFNLSDLIPDSVKLIDVINDFTRMFNIYYWTDSKTKTIYLEPRDTFFKPITSAVDWTDKIDLSRNYEIDYINTYKRNIEFKYKELNNDEWLKGWQDVEKRIYGRYNHVLPDRFAEGTNTIELSLFSAGYGHAAVEVLPSNTTDKSADNSPMTLKVWNEYDASSSLPPSTKTENYNPKVFIFNNGTQQSTSGVNRVINLFGGFFSPNPTTNIPYAIFESYNNVISGINLSFTGADGLFATHYSNMMKNIEDGGRLVAYVKLDDVDINNLDFRKLIYISTPSEITGYYIIEKVQDYKPLSNGTTKVNLFKFEDLGNVAIDLTQKGNNGNSNNNNNTPAIQDVYVVDGGQIIDVVIEDPITSNFVPVIL